MSIFYYIQDSVIAMREDPSLQSKVVSQTFFSEEITLQEQKDTWSLIMTSDGYSGWIPSHSLVARETSYAAHLHVSRLTAHLYDREDIEYGPIQTIPYGSRLQALDTIATRWIKIALPNGNESFIQKGDVHPQSEIKNKGDLILLSRRFLGLPYTWGGRSSFGYDCSGFVQMLYQHIGIDLPRDSHQQVVDTRFQTVDLQCVEPGDLIFFGNAKQHIKHVGMHLDQENFIHATSRENQPWIRVSKLSDDEWSGDSNAFYPYRLSRQLI